MKITKSKSITIVALVILIVAIASTLALTGLEIGDYKLIPAKESIDLGLDLAGGVYVVLEANTNAQGDELQRMMEQTKAIINERVNGLGVSEPNISIEGNNRIRVELAGIDNPQEAIKLIGQTAQLQFVDSEGTVVVTGNNVLNAEVNYQKNKLNIEEPVVSLEFDAEGAKSFNEATTRLAAIPNEKMNDKILYIVLDNQIISYPAVSEPITDGKAIITGGFQIEEANRLATLIRAGALPIEMIELQTSVIGPTLGLEAYDRSILAGGIALLLIFAFMIIVYKIPGLIASLGLIVYVLIVIATMAGIGVKLTLPGIAGLILSIGMAVDANVLIFERIREELHVGKTLRTSIDTGFKRALRSILDANITTLIAGIVLYYFGIGPIKGFGVTLMIGIVSSLITAIFFTKYLLKLSATITGGKNVKIYGA